MASETVILSDKAAAINSQLFAQLKTLGDGLLNFGGIVTAKVVPIIEKLWHNWEIFGAKLRGSQADIEKARNALEDFGSHRRKIQNGQLSHDRRRNRRFAIYY